MELIIKELNTADIEAIKIFYSDVFTNEPWNDDWSNEDQLHRYIIDLTGNANSLTLALFLNSEMVGLCMGHIRHWFAGTEYQIDEFCISRNHQGVGLGTKFLKAIENELTDRGIKQMFLLTERSVPAYKFYKKNDFIELSDHVSFLKKVNKV